jgi:D-sedoheptulose 7-phosphate isomerase
MSGSSIYVRRLRRVLARLDHSALDRGIDLIDDAWRRGRQVITCGNGGSALTALHYIADWNKTLTAVGSRPFRGRCLAENMGLLTAHANDESYQDAFSAQLRSALSDGDLLIAVSCSGNSENVIRAVEYAKAHGAETLGLCGFSGGLLRTVAHHAIWVACDDMQLCEDVHAMFGHITLQTLSARVSEDLLRYRT